MRQFWTKREEEALESLYCQGSKTEILDSFPGRTWTAIQTKAERMGLTRDKRIALPYSSRRVISRKVKAAYDDGRLSSPLATKGVGQPPEPIEDLAAIFLEPLGFQREFCVSRGTHGGPYRLDFAHLRHKIDIELDGKQHKEDRFKERDKVRDHFLRSLGWNVIRISNKSILEAVQRLL